MKYLYVKRKKENLKTNKFKDKYKLGKHAIHITDKG